MVLTAMLTQNVPAEEWRKTGTDMTNLSES